MERILSNDFGIFKDSMNTLDEYSKEVSYEEIGVRLNKISSSSSLIKGEKACYIFGMGSHPKQTYKILQDKKGVEVILYESLLPSYISPLKFIIASYAGLVKVSDIEQLTSAFFLLIRSSMASIFCIDIEHEKKMLQFIGGDGQENGNILFSIKNDRGYFSYTVDADNSESSTGIYEIISYGIDASLSLQI